MLLIFASRGLSSKGQHAVDTPKEKLSRHSIVLKGKGSTVKYPRNLQRGKFLLEREANASLLGRREHGFVVIEG